MGRHGFKINNQQSLGIRQGSIGLVRNQEEACRANFQGDDHLGKAYGAFQFGHHHDGSAESNNQRSELETSELLQCYGRLEVQAGNFGRRVTRDLHIRYYNYL